MARGLNYTLYHIPYTVYASRVRRYLSAVVPQFVARTSARRGNAFRALPLWFRGQTRSAIIIATRHADPYGPTRDRVVASIPRNPERGSRSTRARQYNIRPDPNGPVWIGSQGAKTSVRIRRQPVPHDAGTWETTLAPTQLCRPNCVTWHAAAAASLAAPPVARPSLPRAPPRRPDSGLRYLPCRSCP